MGIDPKNLGFGLGSGMYRVVRGWVINSHSTLPWDDRVSPVETDLVQVPVTEKVNTKDTTFVYHFWIFKW